MKVIRCGPYANQSEARAVEYLSQRISSIQHQTPWYLLTNLVCSSNERHLSDEIDIISISPYGVIVIEVKHWDSTYLRQNIVQAEAECEKANSKAKRVSGILRRALSFDPGFVSAKMLFTRAESEKYSIAPGQQRQIRGVDLFGLNEWKALFGVGTDPRYSSVDSIGDIARTLAPRVFELGAPEPSGPREFGEFADLTPVADTAVANSFHQVFRARKRLTRDRVILHLYDLSAIRDKTPEDLARREYAALQRLQKSKYLPSILDSFQEAPGYPGEMFFFSYVDVEAASLHARAADGKWSFEDRLYTARRCVEAVQEFHEAGNLFEEGFVLHRNLTPYSIRVRTTNEPLLTGLHLARIAGQDTVAGRAVENFGEATPYVAPEVREAGLSASRFESDIYSLCASLQHSFLPLLDTGAPSVKEVLDVLAGGLAEDPAARPSADVLLASLHVVSASATIPQRGRSELEAPEQSVDAGEAADKIAVEFWDEDTVQVLNNRRYRVVTKLGTGSIGTTFKVVEVDGRGEELSGPYVAKAITHPEFGEAAAGSYARVRPHTVSPFLASVFEVRSPWEIDTITALLRWLPGDPLSEWQGVLPLYLEEVANGFGEPSVEAVALRWLRDLCDGLSVLHRAGLIHGDVSPKNLIVDGGNIALTDFDLAQVAGERAVGGTLHYCSPSVERRDATHPADDIFALAASLFHVLFDRSPFQYPHGLDKARGLHWPEGARGGWPLLAQVLDRATDSAVDQRFGDAMEARRYIDALLGTRQTTDSPTGAPVPFDVAAHTSVTAPKMDPTPLPIVVEQDAVLTPNVVPWLSDILRSYAASPKGNAETRGLDSPFARETYVETRLDTILADDIQNGAVSLVLLSGNAGDGKTAFLQNLASRLGLDVGMSAERLWDKTLMDGTRLRANLDGSAAYQGRSATQLLDEFFAPFMAGDFPPGLVHLIAINDGPLLAWVAEAEQCALTTQLREFLAFGSGAEEARPLGGGRIRFIDLNVRSLVGGASDNPAAPATEFLIRLIGKMVDGTDKIAGSGRAGADKWTPCTTCSAQERCPAWRSVRTLRHPEAGPVLRSRLTRVLQAVHQRGETHITARGLRGALGYVLFGWHDCSDLHNDPSLQPPHYWDRAFDGDLPYRQGDLLRELEQLDPALEAHPRIDRYLIRGGASSSKGQEIGDGRLPGVPGNAAMSLASLRRRAFFEWPVSQIAAIAGDAAALDLARGRHLSDFLRAGSGTPDECAELCSALCDGISRLEDLPPQAFHPDWVPLKISPRTPTETAFWVRKARTRFSLRPLQPARPAMGLETLHTHVVLSYAFENGQSEQLLIGAELFHLLLEMRDGYQLSDVRSDDVFANLSVFKQRLAQEEERTLYAWNPLDDRVFELSARPEDGAQKLTIAPVTFPTDQTRGGSVEGSKK